MFFLVIWYGFVTGLCIQMSERIYVVLPVTFSFWPYVIEDSVSYLPVIC